MSKEVMTKKASDNPYLHKDFHGALNLALEYLRMRFGDETVRCYLRRYASAFYAPLRTDLRQRGLIALQEHFERIYAAEGGSIHLSCKENELGLKVDFCPAVQHIRKMGLSISPLFIETERTINAAICEDTPFVAEIASYDPETGQSFQRFYPASQTRALLRRGSARLHRRKK